MSARIAVIVPVLDEERVAPALAARLAALTADTPTVETIVVDGGSRDGTVAALERAGLRVIASPRGRGAQMNAGAAATTAPALLFLHADTALPAGALAAIAAALDGDPRTVGGCFRVRIASRDPRLRAAARLINLRSRLLPSATGDQALFVRRDAFERLGGFRPLALMEDLDFVARLARLGRFCLLPSAVETSARRWERHGVTRTIALMWTLRLGYHLGVDPRTLARLYGHDAR